MTTTSENSESAQPVAVAAVERGVRPLAWMHPDGRVVPASTMDAARRDGGAMLTSLREYTIPLGDVAAERERCAQLCERPVHVLDLPAAEQYDGDVRHVQRRVALALAAAIREAARANLTDTAR